MPARCRRRASWRSGAATVPSTTSTTSSTRQAPPAAGTEPANSLRTLRQAAAPDLDAIYGLDFIRGLADGTLAEDQFAYYLAQDAIYLNGYSRALARASALAPTEAAQLFWARSAQQCLEVESELHRTWLSTRTVEHVLGPVTKSYVDHLLAASASGSYGVLVAALLPCFWLYAEVGQTLHAEFLAAGAPEEHPYAEWLRTYADEDFAQATRRGRSPWLTRQAAGRQRTNGPPWLRRSGSHAVTKWTSSTRRACTPDTAAAAAAGTIVGHGSGLSVCSPQWDLSQTTRRNQPHLRPKAKLAYSRSSVLTPTLGL